MFSRRAESEGQHSGSATSRTTEYALSSTPGNPTGTYSPRSLPTKTRRAQIPLPDPRFGGSGFDSEADDLAGASEALGRFADPYASGQIPEYREIVDTIIACGEEMLAYHSSRRASNGPLEGINNLLQVLRRVAHGFTNYRSYAARGLLVT